VWLADVGRLIVRMELLITRHCRTVARLGVVGLSTTAAETALRLSEESLGLCQAHRQRLLGSEGAAGPFPPPSPASPARGGA
jgi:hypothetical protein